MTSFQDALLSRKRISIWGVGYLGYTSVLRLQDSGFTPSVYDFNKTRLNNLLDGSYPNKEQLNSWSKKGKIPTVDMQKIEVCNDYSSLFSNNIHLISFPNTEKFDYIELANVFIRNKDKLKNTLVIFQSSGIPKTIEQKFSNILKKENINISIATVFRSDWTIETFFNKDSKRVISANSEDAIVQTKIFLRLLDLCAVELKSIEEAEIYENSKNALNYTMIAFFNQLSLSYPHIDVNVLSKELLKDIDVDDLSLGVSNVDYKSEQSIENLLRGSSDDFLTILKEANSTNISFLFYYVNLLKAKNINSVTIIGLSSYNNLKDLRFSPSVMLAEYLHKENIKVDIYDENFTQKELLTILPFCNYIDINSEKISSDVVIVMSLSKESLFFNQEKIDNIGLSDVKYILDNTGFFKDFKYNTNCLYHQLCDGNLVKIVE
ncbi:hypothetical protein M947_11080 [Sulfurimonas hongkongensis]|uniref:UDP-glucose/GDP-mannose dehydrogenase C-terminal domain-containing protein n=1 Tax=Sulfurimonas hongkongensis TaxID=1172190 RepID=T0JC46_9BACT|nr:hypothetical protein [Sulfurimonas hongkongensis]EQB34417.1 hypothetical protein M947_11080 [Sulfurimonas hongkongensis]